MPNGAAFDDAVRFALENPDFGVGVHLSLVDERCVARLQEVRGMAGDDGALPRSYGAFAKAYVFRRFGLRQIRAEIEAQVAKVLDAGIKPTHLDSHQHLHMLPGVFGIVLHTAKNAGIGVVRVPLEQGGLGAFGSARGLQTWVLSQLCKFNATKLDKAGIGHADWFYGLEVSGSMNERNLVRTLGRLGQGVSKIMCHPGFADPATSERYQWGYHWDDEAAALSSQAARQLREEQGVRLASFRNAWD